MKQRYFWASYWQQHCRLQNQQRMEVRTRPAHFVISSSTIVPLGSMVSVFIFQVWPLTQFFLFPFCKKKSRGQFNDPSSGKHYSLAFLPATPSSPSRTLEGLFELTRRPSWALDSPRVLLPELPEIQGHRQVWRTRREGPRTPSRTTDKNLDCAFVENALFYTDPWL